MLGVMGGRNEQLVNEKRIGVSGAYGLGSERVGFGAHIPCEILDGGFLIRRTRSDNGDAAVGFRARSLLFILGIFRDWRWPCRLVRKDLVAEMRKSRLSCVFEVGLQSRMGRLMRT